ncbi:pyocin knob domain-containing protein [Moraxella sp. ZY200743]|uniref:pyocin knob domain-containing protein n=1 Tax=Moraxella sp. ZY200743 TaxID=2911970 RepID=UPI003D7EAD11
MANLRETSTWEAGIYQLETSDPVMGGENGIDNRAPRQLANRTLWLKNELARQIEVINNTKLTKTENAVSASKLATARTIFITGDGTGQASFDGSANANIALTLANSGVTAGSYNSVTVDAKGRVTAGLTQTHGLVTATTAQGTSNVATGNGNTFLNIVASGVGQTASVGSSTQITGTNGITVSSDAAGKLIVTRDSNSPTATKLQTPRTINGVAFDGTQNITITDNTKAPLSHRHTWNEIDGKPAVITNPTQITRGDLDNYKEIGFYYCEADAYARDIANTPSNRAFALEVVRAAGVVQIFRKYETAIVYMRAFYRRWSPWKRLATTEDNAPTARTLAITGDGTGQASFDGSANANIALTLANSGVTAGSYNSVTVDAKGRVTAGLTQTHGLVTATTATGTANRATTNRNTFLNIVASGVGQTASVGSSTQITGTNGITVSSDAAGKLIVTRDSNSPTATKLQTPRTINGVAFDGTRDITIPFNFNVQSLRSDNGYLKFPDGTIIQWVSKNVRLHNLDSLEHTYTMPVQFPNKVVSTNAFVAKPNISASSYIADIVWTQHNWILKCIFKKVINTSTTTDDYTLFILAIGY